MKSINPYTGELLNMYDEFSGEKTNTIISKNYAAWQNWKESSFSLREKLMFKAASQLRENKAFLAKLITREMGKRISESESEIEKCALVCEYYAAHTQSMLTDETIHTDAQKSMAVFEPLGPILAVMPWNYPFWQVFRFAAPALMAGNTALLKHASNVQGCALAIEKVFADAGFPQNVFSTLVIPARDVEAVIAHKYVKAVTLTGSENAGKMVAAAAGKYLKKAVLELGGSDPCIVLDDANIELAAQVGVQSRMLTTGQTCIAAKRFIVVKQVAQKFFDQLQMQLEKYTAGDPLKYETMLAPLAKKSFVNQVHKQVEQSVKMGAKLLAGDKKPRINSCFYNPVILSDVTPGMPVFDQETFGPVIACTVVDNVDEAVKLANQSPYGLGASIWTENILLGEKIARKIEAGAVFVNGLVRSDPRLPFGGIKNSGFGRELSHYGIKEFCNIKSIWIR